MGWQEEFCRVSRVEGSLEGYGIYGGGGDSTSTYFRGSEGGLGARSKSRFGLKGSTKGPRSYIVYTWALK